MEVPDVFVRMILNVIVGCVVDWLLNGLVYLAVNLLISEGGQVQ